jgi:hypothetical protein
MTSTPTIVIGMNRSDQGKAEMQKREAANRIQNIASPGGYEASSTCFSPNLLSINQKVVRGTTQWCRQEHNPVPKLLGLGRRVVVAPPEDPHAIYQQEASQRPQRA